MARPKPEPPERERWASKSRLYEAGPKEGNPILSPRKLARGHQSLGPREVPTVRLCHMAMPWVGVCVCVSCDRVFFFFSFFFPGGGGGESAGVFSDFPLKPPNKGYPQQKDTHTHTVSWHLSIDFPPWTYTTTHFGGRQAEQSSGKAFAAKR